MVEDIAERVLKISRTEALKKVEQKKNERTGFVITFNPALPSISSILQRHWRVMTKYPYLKEVFPSPPMVAFRRATNLKDKLVKARVPPPPAKREKRTLTGMKTCNKPGCETCPFVKPCKEFKSHFNNQTAKLNAALDCSSSNVVYCLLCNKNSCKQFYIGQTSQPLRDIFIDYKSSVRT